VLNLNWIIGFSGLLYPLILEYNYFRSRRSDGRKHSVADDIKSLVSMVLVVTSVVHLCGVGIIGVWVWVTSRTFGGQPECNSLTSLRLLGKKLNALDPSLRKASIAIYAIAAIPVVNTIVIVLLASIIIGFLLAMYPLLKGSKPHEPQWRGVVLVGMIFVSLILDIAFIVSTELMISRGCVREGEGQWTYGQTLALMGLILPIIDTAKMVRLWWLQVNKEDRRTQRRREHSRITMPPVELPLQRRRR
jgi:hypothetical protein